MADKIRGLTTSVENDCQELITAQTNCLEAHNKYKQYLNQALNEKIDSDSTIKDTQRINKKIEDLKEDHLLKETIINNKNQQLNYRNDVLDLYQKWFNEKDVEEQLSEKPSSISFVNHLQHQSGGGLMPP